MRNTNGHRVVASACLTVLACVLAMPCALCVLHQVAGQPHKTVRLAQVALEGVADNDTLKAEVRGREAGLALVLVPCLAHQ